MWSPVQTTTQLNRHKGGDYSDKSMPRNINNQGSPTTRCKHAMCAARNGYIYLFGGRSGNVPLKDLWRFHPGENRWEEIKCKGHLPPNLQEHTMIEWNNRLFVFGGEIAVSSSSDTPLWILDLGTFTWRKYISSPMSLQPGSTGMQPSGRRAHSASILSNEMLIYGGYMDFKGSTSELWSFDLANEEWHLISNATMTNEQPSARHSHSAVTYQNCIWIYGGMTDLVEKGDFWKWSWHSQQWAKIKSKQSPGALHNHSAVVAFGSMFIFGGERSASLLQELWRFRFDTETWEKVQTAGMSPNPRCRHAAIANPYIDPGVWEVDEDQQYTLRESNEKLARSTNTVGGGVFALPAKSVSMFFNQLTDPSNVSSGKTLKYLKRRVNPSSLNLCGKNISTLSDDEEIDDGEIDASSQAHHQQVSNRKSLREKLSSSRLVRSISSSSYNMMHQNLGLDSLRGDLEKLVEENTPQLARANQEDSIATRLTNKFGNETSNYQRMISKGKMHKSISSDAVLESDSESNTPQHNIYSASKARPISEIFSSDFSAHKLFDENLRIQTLPEELNPETEETEEISDENEPQISTLKRHTVHESMSYYSLCFPSPPIAGEQNSLFEDATPSTPSESGATGNNNTGVDCNSALTNSGFNRMIASYSNRPNRFSLGHDISFISQLQDFEEEDENIGADSNPFSIGNHENANSSNVYLNSHQRQRQRHSYHPDSNSNRNSKCTFGVGKSGETALIDTCDANGVLSPSDSRVVKSSGYNSLATLCTPNIESRGISNSVSHSSSGYQSFIDDNFCDSKDMSIAFQRQLNSASTKVVSRRIPRDSSSFELKQISDISLHKENDHEEQLFTNSDNANFISTNVNNFVVRLRKKREARTKSLDRSSAMHDDNQAKAENNAIIATASKYHIDTIEEIKIPNSPTPRRWSQSPRRGKHYQHHWQLCMFVFGGKEKGVSVVCKQPISVWKLFI